jgi:hypothetical protein
MDGRSGYRQERIALARALRDQGHSWPAIADALRDRYGMNARAAMRLAHGWAQSDAAEEWNRRWPDDPKTFKNFSYWEKWPGSTGYTPSMATFDRLAQLYGCDVADLLVDWGRHRDEAARPPSGVDADVLAWQITNLPSEQLGRELQAWSARLESGPRRSLLLKLSTAASTAANTIPAASAPPVLEPAVDIGDLTGIWDSTYRFVSTGRDNVELAGSHRVELRVEHGRLVGRSRPTDTGTVELALAADGPLLTGTWTERTAPDGYYRGAVYRGVLQLVLDPTGRTMVGRWLGPDKEFTINSGSWELSRA